MIDSCNVTQWFRMSAVIGSKKLSQRASTPKNCLTKASIASYCLCSDFEKVIGISMSRISRTWFWYVSRTFSPMPPPIRKNHSFEPRPGISIEILFSTRSINSVHIKAHVERHLAGGHSGCLFCIQANPNRFEGQLLCTRSRYHRDHRRTINVHLV